MLLVNFFNHVRSARRIAVEADVRWAGPRTMATVVEELRAPAAGSDTRVGVVGAPLLQAFQALAEAVGSVVDLNAAYTRLRMIKSPEELEWLRRGAELTDLSCTALLTAPGHTEHDLAATVGGSYLPLRRRNYIHYFSVTPLVHPQQRVPSQWPSARALAAGDVRSCELNISWSVDYPGQLLRPLRRAPNPRRSPRSSTTWRRTRST